MTLAVFRKRQIPKDQGCQEEIKSWSMLIDLWVMYPSDFILNVFIWHMAIEHLTCSRTGILHV